jgi:hypothetical protein
MSVVVPLPFENVAMFVRLVLKTPLVLNVTGAACAAVVPNAITAESRMVPAKPFFIVALLNISMLEATRVPRFSARKK